MSVQIVRLQDWPEVVNSIASHGYHGHAYELKFKDKFSRDRFLDNAYFIMVYTLSDEERVRNTWLRPVSRGIDRELTMKTEESIYIRAAIDKIKPITLIFLSREGKIFHRIEL